MRSQREFPASLRSHRHEVRTPQLPAAALLIRQGRPGVPNSILPLERRISMVMRRYEIPPLCTWARNRGAMYLQFGSNPISPVTPLWVSVPVSASRMRAFVQACAANGLCNGSASHRKPELQNDPTYCVKAHLVACVETQASGDPCVSDRKETQPRSPRPKPGEFDEFVANGAMAAEYALLHSQFLHLLQDHGQFGLCPSTARWHRPASLR